jgi:hypothetical protein
MGSNASAKLGFGTGILAAGIVWMTNVLDSCIGFQADDSSPKTTNEGLNNDFYNPYMARRGYARDEESGSMSGRQSFVTCAVELARSKQWSHGEGTFPNDH